MNGGINLDDLQQVAEKLVALLKDRQLGLMSWNAAMYERLKEMKALIEKSGI